MSSARARAASFPRNSQNLAWNMGSINSSCSQLPCAASHVLQENTAGFSQPQLCSHPTTSSCPTQGTAVTAMPVSVVASIKQSEEVKTPQSKGMGTGCGTWEASTMSVPSPKDSDSPCHSGPHVSWQEFVVSQHCRENKAIERPGEIMAEF